MKSSIYLMLLMSITIGACGQQKAGENLAVNPQNILKDFDSWWNYQSKYINLSKSYQALDESSEPISKDSFLKMLSTGEYVSVRILGKDSLLKYQLYKIDNKIDHYIVSTAKQFGESEYRKYMMEGKPIPDFNFKDLNGKIYNENNTKGKIIVLKFWFINCLICVQEMPALNAFVKEFESRDDVLFISVAFDTEDNLKTFLSKRKFDYAVVHASNEYISEKLGIKEFPTQIIVNRNGLISKVVNDYHDMISCVREELAK